MKQAGEAIKLPAGKYRVDSIKLKLAGADGKVWQYTFSSGSRTLDVEVAKDRETVHQLLDGLKVTVNLDVTGEVSAGDAVMVQGDVVAGGLYMTTCEIVEKFADYGRQMGAEIKLTEPGSVVVDRCESGFH